MWPLFLSNPDNRLPFYEDFLSEEQASTGRKDLDKPYIRPSEHAIKQQISSAVQSVLGSAVADSVPLVQAGLDSLGAKLLFCS